MSGFSVPSMNWDSDNLPDTFASFRQYCELIFDGPYSSKSDSEKAAYLLLWIGSTGLEIYNGWTFSNDADRKVVTELFRRFETHVQPKSNSWLARFQLQQCRQRTDESTDDFIGRCRHMAKKCKFVDSSEVDFRLVEQLIVGTRHKSVQEKLLEKGDTLSSLDAALEISRTHEATMSQMAQLSPSEVIVSAVERKVRPQPGKNRTRQNRPCMFCGKPPHDRSVCPARDTECRHCRKKGHFADVCLSRPKQIHTVDKAPAQQAKQLAAVNITDPTDLFLGSVQAGDDPWMVQVSMLGTPVSMKLDTGADVTVIPSSVYRTLGHDTLETTKCVLRGANTSRLQVQGTFNADLVMSDGSSTLQQIFVATDLKQALLGRPAIAALGLLTVQADLSAVTSSTTKGISSLEDAKQASPNLFQSLGKFTGDPYKIQLQEKSEPFSLSCPRRVPLPLMDKVKAELHKMEEQGVIVPVDEPTDWCSGLVVVPKPSGAVRLCVDYTRLNKFVRREHHVLPAVDHTLGQLTGAKFFTKLDANSGFYQVPLSEESCKLTTFITPFGRYMFTRLPFGICSAPEHFQKRMSRILEGVPGCALQMDDVLVFGATEDEHDARVAQTLQRLDEHGVTLNPDKCLFKVPSVKFLGHLIDQHGIRPDPEKVQGVADFAPCQDTHDVRRFMGMVNQLGKFSSKIAGVCQPINALLKKDNTWCWGPAQQSAFDKAKDLLSSAPVLALYGSTAPTIVSADASSYGIGAVIKQRQPDGQWKPVSYQSRTLTPTEQRYAQIEKEALGLTWACERFADYLVGMTFSLETDHKPLVPLLSSTPLDDVPPRVLRFRLRLLRFDFSISHVPGKELLIADALSRAPGSCALAASECCLIDEAEAAADTVFSSLPASDARLDEIRQHQDLDPVLSLVAQYMQAGWPPLDQIPASVKPYLQDRASFSKSHGILFNGCRILIPASLRQQVLDQLHSGHLGITKCRARAQHSVWWPGLSTQLADHVANCQSCARDLPPPVSTLLPSRLPELPWQKVAMDFMMHDSSHYLVVVDYFSRFVELARMSSLNAAAVINQLKSIFARHGYPETVVSDNGPPFFSAEFSAWLSSIGVQHVTSSPLHPQGNGLAERAVKTVKAHLRKNADPYEALLSYRATPLECGYSPSELLMSRRLRTGVPISREQRRPTLVGRKSLATKDAQLKERQAENFDKRHKPRMLPALVPGDQVYIADRKEPGTVTSSQSERSSIVETQSGSVLRRNRNALIVDPQSLPVSEPPSTPPLSPVAEPAQRVTRSGRQIHTPIRFRVD